MACVFGHRKVSGGVAKVCKALLKVEWFWIIHSGANPSCFQFFLYAIALFKTNAIMMVDMDTLVGVLRRLNQV